MEGYTKFRHLYLDKQKCSGYNISNIMSLNLSTHVTFFPHFFLQISRSPKLPRCPPQGFQLLQAALMTNSIPLGHKYIGWIPRVGGVKKSKFSSILITTKQHIYRKYFMMIKITSHIAMSPNNEINCLQVIVIVKILTGSSLDLGSKKACRCASSIYGYTENN